MPKQPEEPSPGAINSPEALEQSLSDRSPDERRAIALRAALRVLPFALSAFVPHENEEARLLSNRFVLNAFRTAFLAYVLVRKLEGSEIIRGGVYVANAYAATITDANAGVIKSSSAINAAFAIAYAATTESAAEAVKSVVFSAEAAGAEQKSIWHAIDTDIFWLYDFDMYGDRSDYALEKQKLWLIDPRAERQRVSTPPQWATESLDEFARNAQATKGPWGLIVEWYRGLLLNNSGETPRNAFGEQASFDIAIKDEEFWDRDPDVVMADIAEIVGWDWNEQTDTKQNIIDNTGLHGDQPTTDDKLGRRTFARGLVETVDRVLAEQHVWLAKERAKLKAGGRLDQLEGDGFAVHLHAPWGAGKTSVLKMMEAYMNSHHRRDSDRWIVTNFNAWRHERRHPPWHPLLEAVSRDCIQGLKERGHYSRWLQLGVYWDCSRFLAFAGPYLVAALLFLAVFYGASTVLNTAYVSNVIDSESVKNVISFVTSILSAIGVFVLLGQRMVFGSKAGADTHATLAHDPLKRHKTVFQKIIRLANAPICIFIDDLDRCDGKFVVDLLEGIQTAFRHENVVYVVAADKNWIRTSFETCYREFRRPADDVGQSLGYLFLEKIFQISTPVPGMSDRLHADYLQMLLESGEKPPAQDEGEEKTSQLETSDESDLSVEDFDALVDEKRVQLKEFAPKGVTRESADRWLKENKAASDRAAVGLAMIQSQAAQKDFEYRLNNFRHLLPDNPRVMKRLVNAYGFRNLIGYSENNDIDPNQLARWTILEQRFPAAADLFTEHPDWIDRIGPDAPDPADKTMPARLKLFANSSAIREVVRKGDGSLTSDAVAAITRGSRS